MPTGLSPTDWRWLRNAGPPVLVLGLAAALLTQWPGRAVVGSRLDGFAAKLGLQITQVSLAGLNRALPEDVFAALEGASAQSILAFDTEAARSRLEALPWIRAAVISRELPGEITVRISERRPYAVWQNRQMFFLIDEEGHTLEPVVPSDYPHLPIVAGAGAAEEAKSIAAVIARSPVLGSRVAAAVRVAGRRWTLKLKDGPDILLSANDPEGSLARLDILESKHAILERHLAAIDLRQPGVLVLRPVGGPS
ncbi:MAG: cell division protein FtsQ/DivIB [Hyphomicrobiaceae bacterium]